MRRLPVFFIILLQVFSASCSLDDGPNFNFTALKIVNADVPESFNYNETYTITVTYIKSDNCTNFEGFDVLKDDTTVRSVLAIGSVRTDLDSCEEIATEQTATFKFSVIYRDPYTFKFYQGENNEGEPEYLTIMVPVN